MFKAGPTHACCDHVSQLHEQGTLLAGGVLSVEDSTSLCGLCGSKVSEVTNSFPAPGVVRIKFLSQCMPLLPLFAHQWFPYRIALLFLCGRIIHSHGLHRWSAARVAQLALLSWTLPSFVPSCLFPSRGFIIVYCSYRTLADSLSLFICLPASVYGPMID